MKLRLYFKPNTIGLVFANTNERSTFLTALNGQQCAEVFGERSLRLHPDKVTGHFNVPIEIVGAQLVVQDVAPKPAAKTIVQTQPRIETGSAIPAGAIKSPEPIPAVGTLPKEVVEAEELNPTVAAIPQTVPAIPIPQVETVLAHPQTLPQKRGPGRPPKQA